MQRLWIILVLVNTANENLLKGSKKFSSKKSFSSMKREDDGRMKELKPYEDKFQLFITT